MYVFNKNKAPELLPDGSTIIGQNYSVVTQNNLEYIKQSNIPIILETNPKFENPFKRYNYD